MYVAKVAMSRAVSVALKACQLRTHIIPTPAPVQQTGPCGGRCEHLKTFDFLAYQHHLGGIPERHSALEVRTCSKLKGFEVSAHPTGPGPLDGGGDGGSEGR